MNPLGPAAQLEAKANRAQARLLKARDGLKVVAATIHHSELPSEMKLRLMGALKAEDDLLGFEEGRLNGLRKAAELSRSNQKWVTSGDE